MMAVTVAPRGDEFAFSARRPLFSMLPYRDDRQHPAYDISLDDQRFLVVKMARAAGVEVAVHWGAEVRPRLAPAR